jgi:uncharacterized membrane protein YphA (DoxX/SURF4 family)
VNVPLWIAQGLLCLAFLMAGGNKLLSPKEKLIPRMGWAESWPPNAIKALAAAEVLGALGVVLPWATGIAKVLTPLAAVGLAVTMLGAIVVHLRRGEYRHSTPTVVLLILSVLVAVGRF